MKQWKEEYPGKWAYCGKNGHFDLEVSKVPNEEYEKGAEELWGLPEIWEGEVRFTVHFTVEAKDEIFNTFEDLKESLSRSLRNLDVDSWDIPKVDDIGSPEDA